MKRKISKLIIILLFCLIFLQYIKSSSLAVNGYYESGHNNDDYYYYIDCKYHGHHHYVKRYYRYVNFARLGYDELKKIKFGDIYDTKAEKDMWTQADTSCDNIPLRYNRQFCSQTACIEKAQNVDDNGENNNPLVIIDVNYDGTSYTKTRLITKNGTYDDDDAMYAKLAYIAAKAEEFDKNPNINGLYDNYLNYSVNEIKKQNNDNWNGTIGEEYGIKAWEFKWALSYLYNNDLRERISDTAHIILPFDSQGGKDNTYYEDAKTYAENGSINGKQYSARIIIMGGDSQAVVILSGKEVPLQCDVSVEKKRINDEYTEIGNLAQFSIVITNKTVRKITLDVTDTYNTSEYEAFEFDGEIYDINKPRNPGNLTKTIDVYPGENHISVMMNVKETATRGKKIYNDVKISNFKIDGKSIKNKSRK